MAKDRQARKAQRTRGPTGRDEKGERSTPIESLSVRHIGIVVQSFAVFVAISTLLGRIYSLTFYETLGIPKSEINLKVLDYSVVSPEVTIFGVGFSLIMAAFLWSDWQQALDRYSRRCRVLVGLLLIILGICLQVFAIILLSRQAKIDLMYFTVVTLITVIFLLSGLIACGSGVSPGARENDQDNALRKAIVPLIVIVIVIFAVWSTSMYSSTIGEVDARITQATAPQARVVLVSSSSDDFLRNVSGECVADSIDCYFRVILTSDRFVYLQPLDPDSSEKRLYAIPITDIASIEYLPPGNAQ